MLTYEKHRGAVVVKLTGELDHNIADGLRAELDAFIENNQVRRLVFDLDDLEFMDSSGIGMMIGRYKLMARRGGSVEIKCANRRIDRIFEMAGLYQIIKKMA